MRAAKSPAAIAGIWALQGRREQALAALEDAVNRGWRHVDFSDLPDIAHEPAFHSLRGDPRFERVRARLKAHMDRERQETLRLAI